MKILRVCANNTSKIYKIIGEEKLRTLTTKASQRYKKVSFVKKSTRKTLNLEYLFLVTVQINYRGALGIWKSRFGIAFVQILEHSRTKNLNLATKIVYYLCTYISLKDFCLHVPFHDISRSLLRRHEKVHAYDGSSFFRNRQNVATYLVIKTIHDTDI